MSLLSGDWLEQSKALYDDGIIYYRAPRGNYRKQFRKLERKLGINFERVKRKKDAEILCDYSDLIGAAGLARRYSNGTFRLSTDPDYKGQHVEAHEIGHALGLAHNYNEHSVLGPNSWDLNTDFLTHFDRQNISNVFF